MGGTGSLEGLSPLQRRDQSSGDTMHHGHKGPGSAAGVRSASATTLRLPKSCELKKSWGVSENPLVPAGREDKELSH